MNLIANIVGATGLVGKQLLEQLLDHPAFKEVRIFVRRAPEYKHPKLSCHVVDFGDIKSWAPKLNGDVLFSALGTTLKQAGSKENQYEIDFTYNFNFAEAALKNGIKSYVLVSSIGADAKSGVFYTRMKGELDDALGKLPFDNLVVLRPSSLTGNRKEKRVAEQISIPILKLLTKLVLKKYRPISDITVARAMINSVLHPQNDKTIWENEEVFELAEISK